ncbi:alpha/beta fold hydrolase [Mycolicibacterium sp. CBM1]
MWTDLITTPHEVDVIDVNGLPTRRLRAGSGEPIIFLHGMSGHLEAFIRTAPAHVRAGFEVHLIDMLGHGFTAKPDVDYTVDVLAEHVLAYLDLHGFAKANITGISLGGWVVGWLLAHHPERLRRATMVLAAGNPSMGRPEVAELISRTTSAAVLSNDRELTRKRLEQVIHNPELVTDELVEVRYRIYHQPEFRERLDRVLASTRPEVYQKFMLTPAMLQSVSTEVLLVWSEEDAYSPVTGADYYVENLPHNALVVFSEAGHWPPYERPDDFAEVNTAFLHGGLDAVRFAQYDSGRTTR